MVLLGVKKKLKPFPTSQDVGNLGVRFKMFDNHNLPNSFDMKGVNNGIKPADPPKPVDPPNFSSMSGTVLFEKFLSRIFTPTVFKMVVISFLSFLGWVSTPLYKP